MIRCSSRSLGKYYTVVRPGSSRNGEYCRAVTHGQNRRSRRPPHACKHAKYRRARTGGASGCVWGGRRPASSKMLVAACSRYQEARFQHSTIPILSTTQNYPFTSQVYSTFPFMVHSSLPPRPLFLPLHYILVSSKINEYGRHGLVGRAEPRGWPVWRSSSPRSR